MGGHEDIRYCTSIELVDCPDDFKRLQFAADQSYMYNPNARDCWNREGVCIPAGQTVQL